MPTLEKLKEIPRPTIPMMRTSETSIRGIGQDITNATNLFHRGIRPYRQDSENFDPDFAANAEIVFLQNTKGVLKDLLPVDDSTVSIQDRFELELLRARLHLMQIRQKILGEGTP